MQGDSSASQIIVEACRDRFFKLCTTLVGIFVFALRTFKFSGHLSWKHSVFGLACVSRVLVIVANLCACVHEQDLRGALVEAVELTGQSREVFKLFWSAQQRFFKLLCISMKVCCPNSVHSLSCAMDLVSHAPS